MKLTKRQANRGRALKCMNDEDIDLSDIPEMTGKEKLIAGKFYRPKYPWDGAVSLDGAPWPHLIGERDEPASHSVSW